MAGMDPATLQAHIVQVQSAISGMSPEHLRRQFAKVDE